MFFHPMDILIFIAFGISMWAQFRVKGTFSEWAKVPNRSGLTGYEAARIMLDRNGLHDIPVEPIRGVLSDHYDPIHRVVRLSEAVYYERSIAAISVACHEVGHAIQHKVRYPMLVARHRIFPVVNFTSGIAPFLLLMGFLFGLSTALGSNLAMLGILFFSFAVLFQLITLPVEYNASRRAREIMVAEGFIAPDEERGVAKMLNSAALTYVAAALISVLELLKFIMIFTSANRE